MAATHLRLGPVAAARVCTLFKCPSNCARSVHRSADGVAVKKGNRGLADRCAPRVLLSQQWLHHVCSACNLQICGQCSVYTMHCWPAACIISSAISNTSLPNFPSLAPRSPSGALHQMATGGAQSDLARFEQQWIIANGAPPNGEALAATAQLRARRAGGCTAYPASPSVHPAMCTCVGPCPATVPPSLSCSSPHSGAADLAALLLNPNSTSVSLNAERVATAG